MGKHSKDVSVERHDVEENSHELSTERNSVTGAFPEEESILSRGHTTTSSSRLTMFLRSSLRLSAPRKKTSISSARSFTAPNSPNLIIIPRYFNLPQASSSISVSSFGYPFCRICHDTSGSSFRNGTAVDESLGKLIAPCLCDGSLKYVHEKCIQRWIEISHAKRCELCLFEYEMSTYTKPLKEWKCYPFNFGEFRKMFFFTVIYILVQVSVAWALYALISNLISPGATAPKNIWQFWLKVIVVLIGVSCVVVFTFVQFRYYFGICQKWRRINRITVIQEPRQERISKLRLELRASLPNGHEDSFTSLP
ncbi:hypothetical protein Aperf_G00000116380 [Anoplocephala perfoliata]